MYFLEFKDSLIRVKLGQIWRGYKDYLYIEGQMCSLHKGSDIADIMGLVIPVCRRDDYCIPGIAKGRLQKMRV